MFITAFVILQEISVADPWDARSLEWATHTPVPEYNFAITPQVDSSQAFWDAKKNGHNYSQVKLEEIHMPNNSGITIYYELLSSLSGASHSYLPYGLLSIISTIGIFVCMAYRSFEKDHGHHISVRRN